MSDLDLAAFLARRLRPRTRRRRSLHAALDALVRHRAKRRTTKSYRSNDASFGKAKRIGVIEKSRRDRKGRLGFYHVKNIRGQAVLFWRPRG
jgi:hypothetical protein